MKKYKCPECENLTDTLIASLTGECILDANGETNLNYWETGNASCEECGYEENGWNECFEIVEIKED